MHAPITIPERLVKEAVKKGLDIEASAVDPAKTLNTDPSAEARLELAEKSLGEAEEYLAKGDVVQASEKLYKAVEECVKALAEKLGAKQAEEARRRGRWDTWLLGMAATDLARTLGEDRVRLAWKDAYDVHVWGFHEAKYRVEDVEAALPLARWLLDYAAKIVKAEVSNRDT
ncbi:PaREP1 family protein [Thermofilum pendens]|uniref:PaREP8 domain containing protein n=1 Tax=Thermofilum pendens (strain DSM 2475 / Hrk 5) TaxID=368408 RepID=A1RYU2_THEPD|nr:PaREP1 family protein [Thermofilum pendens]ABL78372.1 PaREP8 domain containing protein [Thermofilum pendens Hrk 5]